LTNRTPGLSLAVPAYFHPVVAPDAWERLVEFARVMRFVIVNVHNGPGDTVDPPYVPVIAALQAAGIRTIGYIDTDYGSRDPALIGREARTYRERYGVDGVFMDQVGSDLDKLDHYAQCVVAAKTAGTPFVVLNPGAEPHPGYVDLANVTVTFEGAWDTYQELAVPDWMRKYPAKRFCHLVHSVPGPFFSEALHLAAERHVGSVFVSDGSGANPWDRFPDPLVTELVRSREQAGQSG